MGKIKAEENEEYPPIPYTSWRRPPGPLNVWRVVDGFNNGKPAKFTIQEIPSDRFEDVLDHMYEYFLSDEPISEYIKAKDYPLLVYDKKLFWRLYLKQGISIGIFTDDPNGEKPILVGVNILLTLTKEDKDVFEKFNQNYRSLRDKVLFTMMITNRKANLIKMMIELKGDKCLISGGLSVLPSFRGQKFGPKMLEVSEEICYKYGINLLIRTVSYGAAAKIVERAGYEVLEETDFKTVFNNKNEAAFPNCKDKTIKFLFKRL